MPPKEGFSAPCQSGFRPYRVEIRDKARADSKIRETSMAKCNNLQEVRQHIDRLDRQIVPLLAERAGYVEQAAGFKPTKAAVVDPERIEEIVLKVRHMAIEEGTSPDLIEQIFRSMIDAYIIHEAKVYKTLHE